MPKIRHFLITSSRNDTAPPLPQIDHNPLKGEKVEFTLSETQRYNERSQAERTNASLKDDYGDRYRSTFTRVSEDDRDRRADQNFGRKECRKQYSTLARHGM